MKLGYTSFFVVDPVGRNGGLALLWHDGNGISIKNFSRQHIHVVVQAQEGLWFLTEFYGHPDPMKREES